MIPIGETKDGRGDYTNFEMDLIDTRMLMCKNSYISNSRKGGGDHAGGGGGGSTSSTPNGWCGRHPFFRPSCVPICIVVLLVLLIIMLPLINPDFNEDETPDWEKTGVCNFSCRAYLTESMPEKMTYPQSSVIGNSTADMWSLLLNKSMSRVDLVAFYWTLLAEDTALKSPLNDVVFNDTLGRKIFDLLKKTGKNRRIRIVQNLSENQTMRESQELKLANLASVRSLDMKKSFGSGVLHTKMWTVDDTHLYIGSANMDWRALSQVKELGLTVLDCPCLGFESRKIFDVLWDVAVKKHSADDRLPVKWHFKYTAKFNSTKPLKISLNGVPSFVYFASSPARLCPKNRETDLSAIKHVMNSANRFIYISVMQFAPEIIYSGKKKYWPDLDDYVKQVVLENDVEIRLMVSQWKHSFENMMGILKSLLSFNCVVKKSKIQVKLFTVPSDDKQSKIPYARVQHDKYMVTDNAAYIGTSNWVGDYFTSTAGASIVIFQNTTNGSQASTNAKDNLVQSLQKIFLRDWNSPYSKIVPFNEC